MMMIDCDDGDGNGDEKVGAGVRDDDALIAADIYWYALAVPSALS